MLNQFQSISQEHETIHSNITVVVLGHLLEQIDWIIKGWIHCNVVIVGYFHFWFIFTRSIRCQWWFKTDFERWPLTMLVPYDQISDPVQSIMCSAWDYSMPFYPLVVHLTNDHKVTWLIISNHASSQADFLVPKGLYELSMNDWTITITELWMESYSFRPVANQIGQILSS